MKRRHPLFLMLVSLLVGAAVTSLGVRPARAQWDVGWGGLFGGFNYVPSPGNFLNERSLIQTSRGPQPRPSHSPYSGSPNAYFNRIRDNGFVPHYDVQSGAFPAYRTGSRRSPGLASRASTPPQPAAAQPAAAEPAQKPLLPLASFFDADQRLVWPGESPVQGDLKGKRDRSDEASSVVLNESKQQGVASISSVTVARQLLLDYGRPALQEVRRDQTPRIADSFHLFLLSLYESLAQSALPSPTQAPTAPQR